MSVRPEPGEPTGDLPFKFVGGEACLDFVNTVDWTPDGPIRERLTSYPRLVEWAGTAGLVSPGGTAALVRRAAQRPAEARSVLAEALALRAALHRAFSAAAAGRAAAEAIDGIDAPLASALGQLHLAPKRGGGAIWEWRDADARLDAPLWPVAWSAAALLTGPEAASIRVCAGPDCGWVYVDRSRNHLRRWCEMETCGTREKSRRRAARTI
jgi:predicted RNA-binding Zn ribbon-like protein